jgi:hypothetical protein
VTSANTVGSWKEPLAPRAGRQPLARRGQASALLLADRHVFDHALQLRVADVGPHLRARVEAIAHPQRPGPGHKCLEELRVHLLVHDHAAGGGATLPRRAEAAPERAIDCQVEIGVVHHEDDVLAAHLEMHFLERRRAGLVDEDVRSRWSR